MAEAFLNELASDQYEAESAGLEPGVLNPLVIKVMKEAGIDISNNKTKSVFDFYKQGKKFDYVITVCDEGDSGMCPIFVGVIQRLHWSFSDPSQFEGTEEEKLEQTRKVRDEIKKKIQSQIGMLKNSN